MSRAKDGSFVDMISKTILVKVFFLIRYDFNESNVYFSGSQCVLLTEDA